jgi:hypothetical protein
MRYLLLLLLIGCSTPETQISQTEIPNWLIGTWIPEEDPETNASFEKHQCLIDLTFDGHEYWSSYYFSFAADYDYEPLLSFEATETYIYIYIYIRYSIYSQHFSREIEFTVTRLNDNQITVDINDGEQIYNYGIFNRLQ